MVAYSFQRRFAPRIEDGTKCQTIRAHRRRHARPGEALQLYVGMRTRSCQKIIPDPLCTSVERIRLAFDREGLIYSVIVDRQPVDNLDSFAVADGFGSIADMSKFWAAQHGDDLVEFVGVLISWTPEARVRP
ncbi:MAG: hypothetical protein BGP11_05445 [Rhodobacterales bacterium 65-51]|uniref:hypothetical protein n=1 Tax=uncultured Gemmobacter sp. TaxID=1095917 RepID=UPI0009605956|nr:hypothetical protein [uncultured Gemmobacter sp.]OJY33167.1 MAG: hypothetical protein BGP11_05445 [Rhodobacterales bacterium 65-51]